MHTITDKVTATTFAVVKARTVHSRSRCDGSANEQQLGNLRQRWRGRWEGSVFGSLTGALLGVGITLIIVAANAVD